MKAAKVNAGLAESNGKLLPGLWRELLHVTCGLTACTPGSAPGPTLGNEYGKTLPFTYIRCVSLYSISETTMFSSVSAGTDVTLACAGNHGVAARARVCVCVDSLLIPKLNAWLLRRVHARPVKCETVRRHVTSLAQLHDDSVMLAITSAHASHRSLTSRVCGRQFAGYSATHHHRTV